MVLKISSTSFSFSIVKFVPVTPNHSPVSQEEILMPTVPSPSFVGFTITAILLSTVSMYAVCNNGTL